jgi:hypothetical protein
MPRTDQNYQNWRDVDMEDAEGLLMGDSVAAGAQSDPRSREYQQQVLEELGTQARMGARGRMTLGQNAAYDQTRGAADQVQRGAREGYASRLASRGQGGADVDQAMAGMGAQQSAQASAVADAQMQAGLADRTRDLQSAYSQMARGMRDQGFQEDFARGQAADQASWFDTDYQRGVNERNTNRENEQSGADAEARQQGFENEARYTTGEAGNMANSVRRQFSAEQQDRGRMASMWGEVANLGGSIISMGTGGVGGGGFGGGGFGGEEEDDDENSW